MNETPLFSRPVRVETLPRDGLEQRIEASAAERAALARLNGLQDIASLTADLRVTRAGKGAVRVRGEVLAKVTQTCVITLEPLEAMIQEEVDVRFAPPDDERARNHIEAAGDLADLSADDPPDRIDDGRIDLGALAAEFLALGLDPYPRKPGARLEGEGVDSSAAARKIDARSLLFPAPCRDRDGFTGRLFASGRQAIIVPPPPRGDRAPRPRRRLRMPGDIRIALDAMGGDHGAGVILPAAAIALVRRPDTSFQLYGDETIIRPLLAAHPALAAKARIFHSDVAIKMADKPSHALRMGRRTSSMWQAIEAVKRGDADFAISAGNTGALMAMAKVCLRTMPQVDRPAIAAMWPTLRGESIVLDVGATIGADAQHLVDLAIMGSAMARIIFDIDRPTVGLLNVGVEEIKGLEEVKAAGRTLRESQLPHLDYRGFVEGDDLGKGTVDVIVTEGFTGNIALKTAEGTAKQIGQYIRDAMASSWSARLGYMVAHGAFRALREKMDPGRVNGGVFLGIDGVVIKSHGGANAESFAGAIEVGYDMVRHELLAKIRDMVAQAHEAREHLAPPAEAAS
jgi:phosphate acyltransferase